MPVKQRWFGFTARRPRRKNLAFAGQGTGSAMSWKGGTTKWQAKGGGGYREVCMRGNRGRRTMEGGRIGPKWNSTGLWGKSPGGLVNRGEGGVPCVGHCRCLHSCYGCSGVSSPGWGRLVGIPPAGVAAAYPSRVSLVKRMKSSATSRLGGDERHR